MHDTRDGGGHKPRQADDTVDCNHEGRDYRIVVISFTVGNLVAWVVDNMPCDTIVQKCENECECGRSGCEENGPLLPVKIEEVDEPVSTTIRFGEFRTIIGEVIRTGGCAAVESWGESVRDIELLCFDVSEDNLLKKGEEDNRNSDGKIGNSASDEIIATESRVFDTTQNHCEDGCSKSENDTQKSYGHIIVIRYILLFLVVLVIRVEIMEQSDIGHRVSECVEDENRNNEKGKDLIGESCCVLDESVEIKKSRQ
mmetsp:Transcript_38944/g.54843  ORF Transcript_38944/g.54843 Transcript_38944/m.54843 type:complete len:255 (+) Transcript_38944:712-1476(+)